MNCTTIVKIGDCVIDFSQQEIIRNGVVCTTPKCSPYFWPMLNALVAAGMKGRALSYQNIAEILWEEGYDGARDQTIRTMKMHISDAIGRDKIESSGTRMYKITGPIVDLSCEEKIKYGDDIFVITSNASEILRKEIANIDAIFDKLEFAIAQRFPEIAIEHYKERLTEEIQKYNNAKGNKHGNSGGYQLSITIQPLFEMADHCRYVAAELESGCLQLIDRVQKNPIVSQTGDANVALRSIRKDGQITAGNDFGDKGIPDGSILDIDSFLKIMEERIQLVKKQADMLEEGSKAMLGSEDELKKLSLEKYELN